MAIVPCAFQGYTTKPFIVILSSGGMYGFRMWWRSPTHVCRFCFCDENFCKNAISKLSWYNLCSNIFHQQITLFPPGCAIEYLYKSLLFLHMTHFTIILAIKCFHVVRQKKIQGKRLQFFQFHLPSVDQYECVHNHNGYMSSWTWLLNWLQQVINFNSVMLDKAMTHFLNSKTRAESNRIFPGSTCHQLQKYRYFGKQLPYYHTIIKGMWAF